MHTVILQQLCLYFGLSFFIISMFCLCVILVEWALFVTFYAIGDFLQFRIAQSHTHIVSRIYGKKHAKKSIRIALVS